MKEGVPAPEDDDHMGFRHIWWSDAVKAATETKKHIKLAIECPCPKESKSLVAFEDPNKTEGLVCYGQIHCSECGRPVYIEAYNVFCYEN